MQRERVAAYREYIQDIATGEFPTAAHLVQMAQEDLDSFLETVV